MKFILLISSFYFEIDNNKIILLVKLIIYLITINYKPFN